jgi:hypothetical protein
MRFGGSSLLDVAHSEEQSDGNGDGDGSNGDRGGKAPKQISLTDPQAAWVTRKGIDQFFAYDANYLIDNKAGIILDEGARANRKEEIAITHPWWTASSTEGGCGGRLTDDETTLLGAVLRRYCRGSCPRTNSV